MLSKAGPSLKALSGQRSGQSIRFSNQVSSDAQTQVLCTSVRLEEPECAINTNLHRVWKVSSPLHSSS